MIIDLNKTKKIYFIGIGGIMMSAAARYFLSRGKKVWGSDRESGPLIADLKKLGAKIYVGHKAENVTSDFDLVVYTQAIGADNPELKRVKTLKIKKITIYQLLGLLSRDKFTVTVAGMHGKSTTTAMLGLIMERARLDPTVFVGTKIKEWRSNFRPGHSKYLLSEACEYKDNFLNYHPDLAVINNLEAEHLDYFKNLVGVKKSFKKFVSQIRKGGFLVANTDNKNIRELIRGAERVVTWGIKNEADFLAKEIKMKKDGTVEFRLAAKGKNFREYNQRIFKLKVPGVFNIYNALGAIAGAAILGVKPAVAQKALAEFDGVWRRFEYKGRTKSGAEIYDDYGHHPTEIEATLEAAKEKFKEKKLWVVFQPHLYSRTHDFLKEFAEVLNLADNLILVDIYAAREINKHKISSRDVVDLINKKYRRQSPAVYIPSLREAAGYVRQNLKKGEILMTMGAGEAYKVGEELLG